MAHVGRFDTQMINNNSFHPFLSVIEVGEEAALLIEVSQLMKDVYFPFLGAGVSDFFFEKSTRFHDDNELGRSSAEVSLCRFTFIS
jgi:hypothetical protein